jgi:hypothetical protein
VSGQRALQQAFLLGVALEARDGAQPAGGRGASAATFLEVASEALDVGTAHSEQP